MRIWMIQFEIIPIWKENYSKHSILVENHEFSLTDNTANLVNFEA